MQIWAESGKPALPICNYSQILYQFLTFTQNLKRSRNFALFASFLPTYNLCPSWEQVRINFCSNWAEVRFETSTQFR